MNRKTISFLLIGVLIGWLTVPLVQADSESNGFKDLLHKIIGIMQEVKAIDQQIADNTKAIREKVGAK